MNNIAIPKSAAVSNPAEPVAHEEALHDGRSAASRVVDLSLRYAILLVLIVLLIVTTALDPGFWHWSNITNLISQNAPEGLIAIAMTYILVAGHFDLSVGALFAAGAVVSAELATKAPLWLGPVAAIGVGAVAGAINGTIITRLRVNSLIATLGTGAAFSGLTYIYCHSNSITVTDPAFTTLGLGTVAGFPWAGVILIGLFLIGGIVLSRSVYGRRLYAVGGNEEAARLAGMRVSLLVTSAFMLVGAAATFGGAVLASQIGVGQPTIGTTTALDVFAIVVIGGTSIYGGEGAMWRTAAGLLLLAVMANLFNSLSLDPAIALIFKGGILVLALGADTLSRRRRS